MSQFTKKAIIESFIGLLNRYPLDKISVKDIVDDCGVNRSTFYYYYDDIYALLDEVFRIETQKAVDDRKDYSMWVDGFIKSTSFAIENKRAIYHVYNSSSRAQLEKYLNTVVGDMICSVVDAFRDGLTVDEFDIAIITKLYRNALVGIMLEWLEGGMKDDPVIYIKRMSDLLDGNIRIMLEKAAENRIKQ